MSDRDAVPSDDQAKFEAWWNALPSSVPPQDRDTEYEADVKGWAWIGWQACAANTAAPAQSGEPVAHMAATVGAQGGTQLVWFTSPDDLPIGTTLYADPQPAQAAQSEPAGLAAAMPGTDAWTITVCKSEDVPIGTPLYAMRPAQTERTPTFTPLYKKLMRGDVDICEAYFRLKVVGSCPTEEEFSAAMMALLTSAEDEAT